MDTLEQRIQRVVQEDITIEPYHHEWPQLFELEKNHLLADLPHGLIYRIEHFGSTAVPNLSAKPIIDILVGVTSLDHTKRLIVPILESQGYDYFWRPAMFDSPPYYCWFIKRDGAGRRTHHIHMVDAGFDHWDRLLFRDYLIAFPDVAAIYNQLKLRLVAAYPNDRVAYTKGKTEFVVRVTELAKQHYQTA
ncbi:MAG: GrpB family protein [Deltaproteobacteria bacterium]|nr:GrpB family protein [Deltaproteobacteria bacterium]